MTSRERVLKAIRRQGPDRTPFEIGFTPTAMEKFREAAGTEDTDSFFRIDTRGAGPTAPTKPDYAAYYEGRDINPNHIDLFGVARVPGSYYHFTHTESPLAGKPADMVYDYPMPDYTLDELWTDVAANVEELHEQGFAVNGWGCGHVYETAWQIRGLEDFLMDLHTDPEAMAHLVGRLDELRIFCARRLAEAGVDVIKLGDDIATQKGMVMRPEMWREFLKPGLARAIKAAKDANPDVLTWYHTDGDATAVVGELVDIGLDILNPVQPECMDLAELNRRYGDRLAFWGAIGTQSTMPFGSPDDVRNAVRGCREACGPAGGILLAPTHVIEPDVPFENLVALRDAVHGDEGRY